MLSDLTIQVWEYDILEVGGAFRMHHFEALKEYLTANPDCGFYSLLDNAVRFGHYVGAIQVGDLCIEVLPKTDRHSQARDLWQSVLIDMIFISHRVPVSVSTQASMVTHRKRVLDAYFQLFLIEVEKLLHEGLSKKYRTSESNQYTLRGRLLFHQQLRQNLVHDERFYVAHTTYDRNNKYNAIILQTLQVIASLSLPQALRAQVQSALIHFPECSPVPISDKLFRRLSYDRKTTRYRQAISIAEIILRQYHPDIRSGRQSILAVMFDMNRLWEAYIFDVLSVAIQDIPGAFIEEKPNQNFYHATHTGSFSLEPDIVLQFPSSGSIVIDTKWKYQQRTSIADLRQMYAYGHYFKASNSFLLYPFSHPEQPVRVKSGFFRPNLHVEEGSQSCGLLFADLVKNGQLNRRIGSEILRFIQPFAKSAS